MQKTANEIKSEFELLASGHYQIHSFLYAQEFEQQAYENLIYPLMLVYPLGGNLSGTSYTRNYRVVIADRVLKSEGNELEVESDTQLIALDTLAYWMKLGTNERFSITSSNTITPFWEKWGDEVTGHFVDIGIEEFYDFNSCAIPLSSAIPSPSNPCKDARILINSVVYGNAPSDTNFNVVVKDQLGALVGSLIGGEWIVNTGGACADATYTIEDSLGNVLYTGTIPSGGSVTEVISNSTLNVNKSDGTLISSRSILAEGTDSYNVGDSSAVLKDEDGNVLSTTGIKATESKDIVAHNGDVSVNSVAFDDVLSGGTLNIQVRKSTGNDLIGSKQGQYWRIGDSTAVIKDSANNTLKSEAIMATETENIVINDSVAVIKNSAGTTLKSENILAQATENITISDSTAVIKDSIGTTLKTEPILAEATENITINDSSVNVNKSNGTLISAVSVKAENTASYNVGDSTITNSDSTYDVDVKATESLILPDSQINVNSVDSGDVVSVKTIDVNLEDSLGAPVTPTSVGLVGNTLTIEVPSGGSSPSGIEFQFPIPIQRTSYRTGDEGWRVQNGWYDYTPPAMPKVVAELDYTITNWADTLSSALIVNGVSSTNRFVDAFGAKIAGGASVVIDKLQGVAFTRSTINKANWNAAIDDALTFSVTVNSITFADWYCVGLNDILPTTRMEASVGFAQLIDLSAQLFIFSNNVYTATTNPANTAQMWHVVFSSRNYTAIDKTFGISAIYVHDAKNLITAP
jgi:hypothetical protein